MHDCGQSLWFSADKKGIDITDTFRTIPKEIDIRAVENLAHIMDELIKVPGIDTRVGLDSILGLFPIIGDTISLTAAGYIIYRSAQLGVPQQKLMQMVMNSGLDWFIGLIPIIGDLFDWTWKSNKRNAKLLREHFEFRELAVA